MPGRRVRHSWQEKQGAQTLEGWSTGTLGQKRVLELLVASAKVLTTNIPCPLTPRWILLVMTATEKGVWMIQGKPLSPFKSN